MPRDIVLRSCDGAEAWHVQCRATLDKLDDVLPWQLRSASVPNQKDRVGSGSRVIPQYSGVKHDV